jgi:4-amino-4-deoxy-L-arabinose transferase-like glycosyltransferase
MRGVHRQFIVVLLLAVTVRGGALYMAREKLQADPDSYLRLAQNLRDTGTYGYRDRSTGIVEPTAYRPPLYPVLVALSLALPLDPRLCVALWHLVLGVVTVCLSWYAARSLGLGQSSIVAAVLVACDPILLNQGSLLMTETLAALLSALAFVCLVRASECMSLARVGLAAGSLALAALCRPVFFAPWAVAAVLLPWIGTKSSQGRRAAAMYAAVSLVVLAPWVLRNAIHTGKFIVATTHGGYTLRLGNNPSFYAYLRAGHWGELWQGQPALVLEEQMLRGREQGFRQRSRLERELIVDRFHYHRALEAIRNEPGMFLASCLVRLGRLWQLVPHRIDPQEGAAGRGLRFAVGAWYGAVFILAVLGIWSLGPALGRPPWLWTLVLCACFSGVHLMYWSDMRMRGPLVPIVALVATRGASRWKGEM